MAASVQKFCEVIDEFFLPDTVRTILDLGSRDCREANYLASMYPGAQVFAFECNPESIPGCAAAAVPAVRVIPMAVLDRNGPVEFHPIDSTKFHNIGASSLFMSSGKMDHIETYPQTTTVVHGTRLDTWAADNGIEAIDIAWMDLQGAELLALKGLGDLLPKLKAIHLEVCYQEIYTGQVLFPDLHAFLLRHHFTQIAHDVDYPGWHGDALYVRTDLVDALNDKSERSAN